MLLTSMSTSYGELSQEFNDNPDTDDPSRLFQPEYISTRVQTVLAILQEIRARSGGEDKTIVFVRPMDLSHDAPKPTYVLTLAP